jgi:dTDP-4-dehydrorhamnose reductase
MKRILITGGDGQVGQAMKALGSIAQTELVFPTSQDFDLSDAEKMRSMLFSNVWHCVINLAAYTAVDKAEDNTSEAFLINRDGPAKLAQLTANLGIPLVHVSTDYVFSGELDRPYIETDVTGPTNVYGLSKEAGEREVRTHNPNHAIIRASWVVSPYRSNFIKTMIRLSANQSVLRVVSDQIGAPTSARELAAALIHIAAELISSKDAKRGTFHFCNSGYVSWADIAGHIMEILTEYGRPASRIERISTSEYPTPARRPKNSCLNTQAISEAFHINPKDGRDAVRLIVSEIIQGEFQ